MPDADAGMVADSARRSDVAQAGDATPAGDTPRVPRASWLYYGLGLSLQTVLWALLFLAIFIAVMVGGKLTEFRYVGF
ncbi:MAG TPA: hypothetical protein VFD50_07300 [Thermoleophilia bacterium]|nr:hypothetical protein [Thermoleophilia bacterium]